MLEKCTCGVVSRSWKIKYRNKIHVVFKLNEMNVWNIHNVVIVEYCTVTAHQRRGLTLNSCIYFYGELIELQ